MVNDSSLGSYSMGSYNLQATDFGAGLAFPRPWGLQSGGLQVRKRGRYVVLMFMSSGTICASRIVFFVVSYSFSCTRRLHKRCTKLRADDYASQRTLKRLTDDLHTVKGTFIGAPVKYLG